jgi:hypothetical protein
MRVWNVRNGECGLIALTTGEVLNTSTVGENGRQLGKKSIISKAANAIENFEEENENVAKIWAMDLCDNSDDQLKICCGTANGSLVCWKDNTESVVEERKKERAETAEKDTSIQVLVKAGRFNDAFRTAFDLGRPTLMLEVVRECNWASNGEKRINIEQFIADKIIDEKNCSKLLGMISEWSKTARNCSIAYALLVELSAASAGSTSVTSDTKTKLEVFAEKHLSRLSNLSQKCYIIDAILLASEAALNVGKEEEEESKKPRLE